jgi:hypothetical protein
MPAQEVFRQAPRLVTLNFLPPDVAYLFQSALKLFLCDSAGEKILLEAQQPHCWDEYSLAIFALAGARIGHVPTHRPDCDIVLDWLPCAVLEYGSAPEGH